MFAALHVPDLPVVAALRADPQGRGHPCGILAPGGKEAQAKLPLLALNCHARASGILPGWQLNRALVCCPNLRLLVRNLAGEAEIRDELVRLGETLTSDLEVTSADSVILDLSLRRTSADMALEDLWLPDAEIWQARASSPDLAHLAAIQEATRGRFITPADLAALPLQMLGVISRENATLALLELWGLRTLGEFMALPRQALSERLGPEVGRWHDLLHGKSCRMLRLHRPPESLAQSIEFEDPVISLDPVIFALKRLLHTLSARLAARHLAARSLDLRLVLEGQPAVVRLVRFPEPQIGVENMLSPLQAMLDSIQLPGAVSALHLDAESTFATAAQREWFGRHLPQPERWTETLSKLEAMLGPGRVGIPVPPEPFTPDAFTLHPVVGTSQPLPERRARPACPVPLHRFRPPREIAVAHEMRGRRPWPLALLNGPHPGEIVALRGPFPASGAWWKPEESWQRLEWDIQLASHHLLRLVFQTPDRWQLDGIYP
jgi:protein ImuB